MSFQDKLKRAHFKLPSERVNDYTIVPAENEYSAISEHWYQLAEITNGTIVRSGKGFFFFRESRYTVDDIHGNEEWMMDDKFLRGLQYIAPELEGKNIRLDEFIFFDLETSGISGGAGTIAFLIGTAYFDSFGITVKQWILPDFSYEHIILDQFTQLLKNFKGIVSFNGKAFDVPILRNRYRLNRLESILEEKFHLDLLHPFRRIWGRRLGSCRLQNLEKELLGLQRVEDIPAELIPQVFFQFLYGEGLEQFKKILEHNALDLANLVKLTMYVDFLLQEPHLGLREPADFLELLRFWEKWKKWDLILAYTELYPHPPAISAEILKFRAKALKRNGEFDSAAKCYRSILDEHKKWDVEVLRDLLIILEHKLNAHEEAISRIQTALKNIQILKELKHQPFSDLEEDLLHRFRRIRSWLDRQQSKK